MKYGHRLKKAGFEFLVDHGFTISRCSDPARLRELIERMHPRTTGFDLMRLGGDGDGGYLIPDDLEGLVACFSPGVSDVATFEEGMLSQGIPCFLADASVAGPPIKHPLIHFEKKFLGVVNDESTITLDSWVEECAPRGGDLILQMDIEGAEWPVLLNVCDATLDRFRIIVLELHNLESLFEGLVFDIMSTLLDRLLRRYHVVHLHPNNLAPAVNAAQLAIPRLLEITLLRKDRGEPKGYVSHFPNPLDRPNLKNQPDQVLPSCWYRSAKE
jgi:hypothetical protein